MILLFTLPGRGARRARGRPPEAPRAARLCLRPVRVGASEPVSRWAACRNLEPVEPTRNLELGRPRRQYRFLSGGWVHASERVWEPGNRVPRLREEGKPGRLRKGRGGIGGKGGLGWGRGRARGLGFSTSLRPRKPVGPAGARGGRTYCQIFAPCIVAHLPFPFHGPPQSESPRPLLGSTFATKWSIGPLGALPRGPFLTRACGALL